jgi:hypothetical protein
MQGWKRHFFYTATVTRTTWKLRLAILALVIVAFVAGRGLVYSWISGSLTCTQDLAVSDVALVENFDPSYPLFQAAATLESAGIARRVLVPVDFLREPDIANPFSQGMAELMARRAGIKHWDMLTVRYTEPISLNAAVQIQRRLAADNARSMVVVTPGFRSRRAALVYRTVFEGSGIQVRCAPVFTPGSAERWMDSWHGIWNVGEQFVKLQYYRFYVLPFASPSVRSATARAQ